MDNSQAPVPAYFVKNMLSIAAKHHCDIDKLLMTIGIDPADIDNNGAISALHYGELHHHIIELVQDEWFGLLSGGQVPKGAIRLLCQTVVHCKDLEQAIIRCGTFFEICRGFKIKQVYRIDGDYVTLQIAKLDSVSQVEFDQLIADTSPGVIKSTLSVWHGLFSWLIGSVLPIDDTYFTFGAPQPVDPLSINTTAEPSHFPDSKLHYQQSFIGYRFQLKYLHYPIIQQEQNVEDFMRKAPYYALIKTAASELLAPAIKALLAKNIGDTLPTALQVAESLAMSTATLHRRLSQEGHSFQSLKNASRMEAAIHYLNCPDISTAAISDLLSFENPSTFFRAFKQWTGVPPGEYRRQLLSKTL